MMKNILFLTVTLLLVFINTNAQDFKFGAGPVFSLPVGESRYLNSIGFGAEITGILEFSESIQAFGQLGYQNFLEKNFLGTGLSGKQSSHIPLIIGARYHSSSLLLGAGIGYGIGPWYPSIGLGSSGFILSPQLGFSLEKFDLIAHFTASSIGGASHSYIGMKTYYKF